MSGDNDAAEGEEEARAAAATADTAQDEDERAGLEELLIFIRDARGFDFTGYKRSTLARRISKRMREVGIEHWRDYRDRLEIDAEEFRVLFNTILINVTSFFRDVEAWRYLQREVVPEIVNRASTSHEFRIWSAGCSSGEEAYSLAIVFAEVLGLEEAVERVKIYGTDVDDEALHDARLGTYSPKALEPLPPELREKYFERNGGGLTFRTDLRRRVIFGRHDLTRDAPISRLDLLVCRNTLMYFNVEAQNQIMDRLHFALAEDGFLFLGKAETLLSDGDRFGVENMRQRIFRRRPGRADPVAVPIHVRLDNNLAAGSPMVSRKRELRELLVEAAPVAVVGLDDEGTIVAANLQARTHFGLTAHDVGRPLRDHELSYRPVELRSLIDQAQQERRTIRLGAVERRTNGAEPQYFDVVVQPLWGTDGLSLGTSISFVDTTVQTRVQQEVKRVREDLETAYEELQSTNEELETTNEELQSSIEELETTNEELQSTNEELETTNEELQSGNEELETMNEEMRVRSGELDETRTFLEGVLSSIGAAVVVLDGDLNVRTWNSGAEELWGLRHNEVLGASFFGLDIGLPTEQLRQVVDECLASGRAAGPKEVAAVNRRGRAIACSVQASPLRDGSAGVVLLMETDRVA